MAERGRSLNAPRLQHLEGSGLLLVVCAILAAGGATGYEITYEDAIRTAVERSPNVKRAAAEVALAETLEPAILAVTETRVVAEGVHAWDEAPKMGSEFFGKRNARNAVSFGLRQNTLVGTRVSLGVDAAKQDSDSLLARDFNPWFESSVSLSVRQSLLKNLLGRPDRVKRAGARAGVKAAKAMEERVRSGVRLTGAEAFLDLVLAERELGLREEAVKDAREFLKKMREKRGYSLVDESSIAQAEANLELRQLELDRGVSIRRRAKLRLLTVMRASRISHEEEVTPVWRFERPHTESMGESVEELASRRPDVVAMAAREEMAGTTLKLKGLEKMPALDVIGSYGFGGMDTSLDGSFRAIGDRDHPTYMAGVALSFPLRSVREKNEEEAARNGLIVARSERERVEDLARLEILTALERFAFSERQLVAAEEIAALQGRKLEMERKNFDVGRSTTEVLIRFAEEKRGAERQVLNAKVEFMKAHEHLRHSIGAPGGER